MKILSLNGNWLTRNTSDSNWLSAIVPGSVFKDLLDNNMMPDPFFADNEYKALELSKNDFEYKRTFNIKSFSHNEMILVCEGLDTLCDVYINNHLVLKADNMHRTYKTDIKPFLVMGENEICVYIHSATNYVLEQNKKKYLNSCADAVEGISHIRKAHSMFGWDWGPKIPDAGIWRDIYVEAFDEKIEDVYITQKHCENSVWLNIDISAGIIKESAVRISIKSPDGKIIEKTVSIKEKISVDINIENPQLWWVRGLGEQPLYEVTIDLICGTETADSVTKRIGLRTLSLKREKDEWGESFEFVNNGVAFFSMGADFIPEDNLLSRRSPERTRRMIDACVDANFNTIRVWGGGYYPDDYFYDMCDEAGIIIWQDHLYACGVYDFTDEFKASITQETIDNVKRLRHHACLALWCGNNEMEMAWEHWGWAERYGEELKQSYINQFENYLPGLMKELDPETDYVNSSPSSGECLKNTNDENKGDTHYWDVWHGRKPFTEYRKLFPRFMSEFGLQSFPSLKTVESFTEPNDRNIFSYVMECHQKNGTGNEKILYYISQYFRYPKDLDSLLYVSQLIQAEGIRTGVEHWRRNRGRCMGALYWQLNDCWPVASWSSIDYYGRYKALHYFAKRFYAPVAVSALVTDSNELKLFCVNETMNEHNCKIICRLMNYNGTEISRVSADVLVEPLSAGEYLGMDLSPYVQSYEDKQSIFADFELIENGKVISSGVELLCPAKHSRLENPNIITDVVKKNNAFYITLSAEKPAFFTEFSLKNCDAVFSDNCFYIPADKPVTVSIKKETVNNLLTAKEVKKQLVIRSLFDTFE